MRRKRPPHRRFDRRAVSAVEFALVCMPFVLCLMAAMGVGLNFYFQQALDFATKSAARQVQLGNVPASYTQAQFVANVFCPSFGMLQACTNIYADLRPVIDYQEITAPTVPDSPASTATNGMVMCPGQPGQLMYLHIVYFPPSLGSLFGLSTAATALVSNTSFANENPSGITVVQADGC